MDWAGSMSSYLGAQKRKKVGRFLIWVLLTLLHWWHHWGGFKFHFVRTWFRDAFAVFSYIRIQSFISHKIGKSLLGGEVAVEGRCVIRRGWPCEDCLGLEERIRQRREQQVRELQPGDCWVQKGLEGLGGWGPEGKGKSVREVQHLVQRAPQDMALLYVTWSRGSVLNAHILKRSLPLLCRA